jgi:hypothetical protein
LASLNVAAWTLPFTLTLIPERWPPGPLTVPEMVAVPVSAAATCVVVGSPLAACPVQPLARAATKVIATAIAPAPRPSELVTDPSPVPMPVPRLRPIPASLSCAMRGWTTDLSSGKNSVIRMSGRTVA